MLIKIYQIYTDDSIKKRKKNIKSMFDFVQYKKFNNFSYTENKINIKVNLTYI